MWWYLSVLHCTSTFYSFILFFASCRFYILSVKYFKLLNCQKTPCKWSCPALIYKVIPINGTQMIYNHKCVKLLHDMVYWLKFSGTCILCAVCPSQCVLPQRAQVNHSGHLLNPRALLSNQGPVLTVWCQWQMWLLQSFLNVHETNKQYTQAFYVYSKQQLNLKFLVSR